MPYQSVTLSSVGNSDPCALNWTGGRPTSVQVITSSSVGTGDFTLQYTLDDIMRVPSTGVYWSGVSSSPYLTPSTSGASAIHYTSSTIWPDGVFVPFLSPVGAVRLGSTALSSNTLTLKVMQGDGG